MLEFWEDDATKGWCFVALACVSFGSFGLPIKHSSVVNANVHPLAYQTYKSFWCFVTSWLVLLWHPLDFTCWGFVSAAFWVPAGVAAVVSISNCGMAVGQGIWTTLIVIVSFIWGAFIFDEEFKSLPLGCGGAGLIILGAYGMTMTGIKKEDEHAKEPSIGAFKKIDPVALESNVDPDIEQVDTEENRASTLPRPPSSKSVGSADSNDSDGKFAHLLDDAEAQSETLENLQDLLDEERQPVGERVAWQGRSDVYTEVCGMRIRRRTYGILAAVFNGCYGGSVMAPLKFAGGAAAGISFVISFGVGVLGITSLIWFVWWVGYQLGATQEKLPSLQIRVMLVPGTISGLLWALGNFSSIYAVIYLGQATGYSACQANLAISGAWGIFYYQEQISRTRIMGWFASAIVALSGIVLLTIAK